MYKIVADILMRVGIGLVPTMDADPTHQYAWRVRVALVTCSTFGGLILFFLFSIGMLPKFDGFAQESELKSIASEMKTNRQDRISVDLLALQSSYCKQKDSDTRQIYWGAMARLKQQYFEIAHVEYTLPDCNKL